MKRYEIFLSRTQQKQKSEALGVLPKLVQIKSEVMGVVPNGGKSEKEALGVVPKVA
jgi:hypothetical protein